MYALTGNDDSSSSSSYPSGKNQLNRRNTREKKWWTTPQPWVKHFCGCNPPVPPVAKSKALTPTKNSSIDYMINAAAVFISKTQHVFKYAMLCIKPTAEHQFYALDSSPKNKIVIIHVWTFRQNEMRIFMHLDPYWKWMLTETKTYKKSGFGAKWGRADNNKLHFWLNCPFKSRLHGLKG